MKAIILWALVGVVLAFASLTPWGQAEPWLPAALQAGAGIAFAIGQFVRYRRRRAAFRKSIGQPPFGAIALWLMLGLLIYVTTVGSASGGLLLILGPSMLVVCTAATVEAVRD